jgi:hypothetical protein
VQGGGWARKVSWLVIATKCFETYPRDHAATGQFSSTHCSFIEFCFRLGATMLKFIDRSFSLNTVVTFF